PDPLPGAGGGGPRGAGMSFSLSERQQAIAVALATVLQIKPQPTNDDIHAIVGGKRTFVNTYMKQWRADQRVAVPPVAHAARAPRGVPAPGAPRPPLPPIAALRQRVATAEETGRRILEKQRQQARELAEARSAYGNALIDAQRLVRQLRQHHVATLHRNPTY